MKKPFYAGRMLESPTMQIPKPHNPGQHSGLEESHWSEEQLFFDPGSYFAALLADIRQAREEIILETYIFKRDATGEEILAALQQAAERGVRIKLLIDGMGSSEDAESIAATLQQSDALPPRVEVRIYHPLPWNFSAYRWAMKHRHTLVKLWRFIVEINHRDHRKLCIIDEHIAWLGSFNITAEHQAYEWHDSAVRLTGEPVLNLKMNFFHVWQHRDRSTRRHLRHFLSNHSLKLRQHKNAELIRIIEEAKTRIWITNAYFSPSNALIKALKAAIKRNVNIQVIVPSRSDVALFPALTRTFYADLITAKLRFFEFNNNILHSKTMLVDNVLIIGSTNLNCRSYFHDLELDAILTQPQTILTMENKFYKDLGNSNEITLRRVNHFPRAMMLFGWISRLLRYWL